LDDQGWRDRFGLPEAVQRQRAYAKVLRLPSVYTPQVVIDGRNNFVGNDRASIGRALAGSRSGGVAVVLSVRDGDILVDWASRRKTRRAAKRRTERCSAGGISAHRGLTGRPRENAGRTLKEFNIVRGFHSLADGPGKSSSTVRGGFFTARCHRRGRPRTARGTGADHRGGGHRASLKSGQRPINSRLPGSLELPALCTLMSGK